MIDDHDAAAGGEDRSVLTRAAPEPDEVRMYGDDPDQLVEIYRGGTGAARRPVLCLVHGGFWRPAYDRTHLRPFASALRDEGRTVVSVEYRRVPGDPDASTTDIRAALALAAEVGGPIVVAGHSAGGHLALWAAASGPPPGLVATVALAPVADLVAARRAGLGDGAVAAFLGADPDTRPDLDPIRLGPIGSAPTIVHGERDRIVPPDQARRYADAHPGTEVVVVPGAGHFALIDPLSPAWPVVRSRLVDDPATCLSRRPVSG
ncbi:alpha/beta hydrolase [Pseudonocardia sp. RS11V-5]|uniref:alpha/beta hydrolase n=1 Tax=Pseudonocardia terrae TaxID=2905831 RepID=UPI001E539573|nr:alpha/beta hydrolase [Pseudonocardia terrae]MCE3555677.1 alpha/beta hydrolase [Pseudonocardia terrae]